MAKRRRSFSRPLGQRRYKRLFLIAAEGAVTEPNYFGMLDAADATIRVKVLKGKHNSDPANVLKRMKATLTKEALKKNDEAWLVIDHDGRTDDEIRPLHDWSLTRSTYGLAVSTPKVEYWLLLHFEDGKGVSTSRQCTDRLKRYLPNYDKGVDVNKLKGSVQDAIARAETKDSPPCQDWPRKTGTTVYRLVKNVLAEGE